MDLRVDAGLAKVFPTNTLRWVPYRVGFFERNPQYGPYGPYLRGNGSIAGGHLESLRWRATWASGQGVTHGHLRLEKRSAVDQFCELAAAVCNRTAVAVADQWR